MNVFYIAVSSVTIILSQLVIAQSPKEIPISKLGDEVKLIGKTGVPLGKLVTITGVVIHPPRKGFEGRASLLIQRIGGKYTQENVHVIINETDWKKWDEDSEDPFQQAHSIPEPIVGKTYEMEGYETGRFVGTPKGVETLSQTTGYYFQSYFVVLKSKPVKAITYNPAMFTDRQALMEGMAQNVEGNAVITNKNWKVIVKKGEPWADYVAGKQVETFGEYVRSSEKETYTLVDGKWRLVQLKDQLNRKVHLRAIAWSRNGHWWLNYRGTELYVEGMGTLPKWPIENHGKPVIIEGLLERATFPRGPSGNGPKGEYFVVKNATWKVLPNLLNCELGKLGKATQP